MPGRYTVGRYVLVIAVLIFAFDIVFGAMKWYASMLDQQLRYVRDVAGGDAWLLSTFVGFMESMWSWLVFILTNAMAFAAIIFLSLMYEAFESEWR